MMSSTVGFGKNACVQRWQDGKCGSFICADSSSRNIGICRVSRRSLSCQNHCLVGRRKCSQALRSNTLKRIAEVTVLNQYSAYATRHARHYHHQPLPHLRQPSLPVQCCASTDNAQGKSVLANGSNDIPVTATSADSSFGKGSILKDMDCVGTGTDVECLIPETIQESTGGKVASTEGFGSEGEPGMQAAALAVAEVLLLVSPFFFWGTAMVAMKTVLPKAGNMFVAATRLIPSGMLLVGFAASKGRPLPNSALGWFAITLFAVVDAACFQGFLAEGLGRTSAGLGSVIIDSQPLTVAVLAALFLGESIGPVGVLGLATGVVGLCLLEVPEDVLERAISGEGWSSLAEGVGQLSAGGLWESGEWWMLLAAQSMAVGTVMVPWICRYADPIMATGWHMVIGGIPLLLLSAARGDPALTGHISELNASDWASLFYASVFGGAIGYGVFFFNANKGNLTRLSSLTFLTPMFAAIFGYIFLGETLTPLQLFGAFVTLGAIYFVNAKPAESKKLPTKEN